MKLTITENKIKKQRMAEKILDKIIKEFDINLNPHCPLCGDELNSELKHRFYKCQFENYVKLYNKENNK